MQATRGEPEAGVPVKVSRYADMIHDFPDLFEEPGKQALNEIASALQSPVLSHDIGGLLCSYSLSRPRPTVLLTA